jgi:hypothetical protein
MDVSNMNGIYTDINTRATYKTVIILFLIGGNKAIDFVFGRDGEEISFSANVE